MRTALPRFVRKRTRQAWLPPLAQKLTSLFEEWLSGESTPCQRDPADTGSARSRAPRGSRGAKRSCPGTGPLEAQASVSMKLIHGGVWKPAQLPSISMRKTLSPDTR